MGVTDNTLVLFSSDNGPEAHSFKFSRGSAWPLKGMKTQLWDGGVREPGILCWPGKVPAGKTSNAVASFLDVFPTFCAAAGAAIPQGLALDGGMDLVRIAKGDLDTTNRSLFFEFHFPQRGVASSLPIAVRRGKWKLFSNFKFDTFELYDMASGAQRHIHAIRTSRAQSETGSATLAGPVCEHAGYQCEDYASVAAFTGRAGETILQELGAYSQCFPQLLLLSNRGWAR
jgi:arylsulfatase A-like enzyme